MPLTQRCTPGYKGPVCARCDTGYYAIEDRCELCADSTDQERDLYLVVLAAICCMCLLSLAVAFLPATPLAFFIQMFVLFQELAAVMVQGAKNLPVARKELTSFATYVNLGQSSSASSTRSALCCA
jgi:hypothetical protein